MAEKHPLPVDGTPTAYSDWPTLIERAVDDVSRILRSEVHMLQTRMETALELQISKTVAHLTIIGMMISGALCILCAAILWLHQWLPWWQSFGIVGVATSLVAIAVKASMKLSTQVKP